MRVAPASHLEQPQVERKAAEAAEERSSAGLWPGLRADPEFGLRLSGPSAYPMVTHTNSSMA